MDSFTETTTQSWWSRIVGSITGIFFGLILLLVAAILLFWNEGRAVHTAQSLKEGAKSIVIAKAEEINPAFESKLVYVAGEVKTPDVLSDPVFGVTAPAIRLVRDVSMYQWKQEESEHTTNNTGGSSTTTKTYSYSREWSSSLIDSSEFKHPDGHANPTQMEVGKFAAAASHATLGAFDIPSAVIDKMPGDQPYTLGSDAADKVPAPYKDRVHLSDGGFYLGKDPANPQIGDEKITYKVLPTGIFSIIAEQTGKTFEPFTTHNGEELILVDSGNVTADQMFHQAESNNKALTWILRAVGVLLMFFGVLLILNPIVVLADVLPFLGSIASFGVGLTAFTVAMGFSVIVIAIAWLAYRPVLAIILFVLVLGGLIWLIQGLAGAHKAKKA